MRLGYLIFVWIAGIFAALGFGIFLHMCGVWRPENYVLWIMIAWTVYRAVLLVVWLERVFGG
ncbi:hypothetical protein C9I56_11230 [Paraburkholderia caribensis]|uniref:hypothetical protein n=1 Tax=Paraburkholderia caribensis TaxID=75105 RepID=UPI000D15C507|nr:hypothetical protein [Paraburkholderia caribensis]PTB28855.1 hypothetical protein C9I56_11230 [Paraburkholderia caribensis]